MVAVKEKLCVRSNRVAEDHSIRKTVGVRSFKISTENENVKFHGHTSVAADCIKKGPINKGTTQTSANDAKFNVKMSSKIVEKSKDKHGCSVKINVGRKVLADVSNLQGNISRKEVLDGSKPGKGKSERCPSLQRVSVGPGMRTVNASSRKSITGKVRTNLCEGVSDYQSLKRGVGAKDAKVSSGGRRAKDQDQKSVNIGRPAARNHSGQIRNSLPPVLKRVNKVDATAAKEKDKTSEVGGKYFSVKARVGEKVMVQVGQEKIFSRNRGSDDFIIRAPRGQTNVDSRGLSRKSIRPLAKSSLSTSSFQRTSKSNSTSGSNKLLSVAAISSKKREAVTSTLPENAVSVVPHEPTQGELPSNGNNDTSTKASYVIARRKSNRRSSFTSLLVTGSKLLEEQAEITKQENLPSIDDNCNHLEVAEYVDEIYQYYWFTEAQAPCLTDYMKLQTEITPQMRSILINWLIEVHFKFDLMPETLYLTVTLLDQYLSLVAIKKNEMQLVGLTALLLASKYEDFWHPRVRDLISISAESYTRDHVLGMEKLMLNKLKFRLNSPTPYVFMSRFLKAAQSDTKFEHLAFYLVELSLMEYEALKFKPSLLCASAIYVARCTLQMTPAWTPLLGRHARYDESQIRNCAKMILRFHKVARAGLLKVIYEKYLRPELSGVAGIKPLDSLI
ncbi:putative cyclin-B3-1 isoform X2 [Malania oleifera]|uniref:putative cyclin-B3-1 isoform X2 n=1 Tax=Malania oleifera TaxID=397392 RepID=UPI0025ADFF39|nr:putative cyclin-B3-1 isoform X2 [Malania oleifera]